MTQTFQDESVLSRQEQTLPTSKTIVGSRESPYDARLKLTGELKFGEDIYLPDMLYGKILRSEYTHARITKIDTSRAEKIQGVRAIITWRDFNSGDQTIMANERVLYYGQPICAVAADTVEIAESALSDIQVEYERLPAVVSIDDALNGESVQIHPGASAVFEGYESKNIYSHTRIRRGDTRAAFETADYVLEETYETQRVHQSYIEPRAATALAKTDGKIIVWTSTQSPFLIRNALAKTLSLTVSKIQVISTGIGGGFGGKLFPEIEAFCAALSRNAEKRPVKIVLTREEEFVAGTPRPAIRFWIKSAVKKGLISAREGRAYVDSGAFGSEGAVYANLAALQMIGPYNIGNVDVEGLSLCTNKQPCGSYRAPGSMETAFAVESHTDSLARKGRMDPVEFRLRNLSEDGDIGPTGQILGGVGAKDALRRVAEKIDWKKHASKEESQGNIRYGIGFACGLIPTVGIHSSGAIVRLNEDGKFVLESGAQDIGTGALMGLKMIAAQELGITCDDIILRGGDTDSAPWDGGAQGSRTTYTGGNAVLLAALDAKDQILKIAAEALEVPKQSLFLTDGEVKAKDKRLSLKLADVADIANSRFGGPIIGRGSFVKGFPEYDKRSIEGYILCPSLHDPAYMAHAAKIEVNLETGSMRIVRYVAAHDVGTAINPAALEGQIHGGVSQGIGYALLESLEHDDAGVCTSLDFGEYKIPVATDIPEVETLIVEGHYGGGPYGAKGAGEANIVPPAGAIANAIFDAIGVRILKLPITPERIRQSAQ